MRSKGLITAAALGLALAAGAALAQDTTTSRQRASMKYTAGQSIVLTGKDGPQATGDPGGTKVSRISMSGSGDSTATTATPQGSTYGAQTGERAGGAADVATVTGTVQAYEAGRSITITRPDGTQVTYTITAQSAVPQKLTTGKTVTVRTRTVSGQPTVERVTYTTTTTTTTTKKSTS